MDTERTSYRAVTVTGRRQWELVERRRREPAPGEVRLRVEACGICHTDVLAVDGLRADPAVPIVPGHEIVGVIEAVGAGVDPVWQTGERVGVGFLGGPDNSCESCRRGDFVNCTGQPRTGTDVDGGYAEVTYARASGLVRLPVRTTDLIFGGHVVRGLVTGTAIENEDNLRFSLDHRIRSLNEVFPLGEAPKAYERMASGEARFRVVLDASA